MTPTDFTAGAKDKRPEGDASREGPTVLVRGNDDLIVFPVRVHSFSCARIICQSDQICEPPRVANKHSIALGWRDGDALSDGLVAVERLTGA